MRAAQEAGKKVAPLEVAHKSPRDIGQSELGKEMLVEN